MPRRRYRQLRGARLRLGRELVKLDAANDDERPAALGLVADLARQMLELTLTGTERRELGQWAELAGAAEHWRRGYTSRDAGTVGAALHDVDEAEPAPDRITEALYDVAMGGVTPEKEAWLEGLAKCDGAALGIGVGMDEAGELRKKATCLGCGESWLMPAELEGPHG